jgi:hypothetical protein
VLQTVTSHGSSPDLTLALCGHAPAAECAVLMRSRHVLKLGTKPRMYVDMSALVVTTPGCYTYNAQEPIPIWHTPYNQHATHPQVVTSCLCLPSTGTCI